MSMIEKVKKYVEYECKKPTSKYWFSAFAHFEHVVKLSNQLADEIWADKEIIEIAAWLHDIGSILYWRENHHITWAEISEKKLREFWYPEDKIMKVKNCILNHRWSTNFERLTIEEKILSEADTISAFYNIHWLFEAAYVYEKLDTKKWLKTVLDKLDRKWEQLHFEESKKILKERYEAIKVLFDENIYE